MNKRAGLAILVAALGYFVDIYDLLLFGVVRLPSLASLGITGDAALSEGAFLLDMQMIGMLLGGVLWGMLADKRGRLSVLFGSIVLYSLANLANGLVQNVSQYAVLRFLAGVGLAGELGAGITLVSESMPAKLRGYGTTIVASIGILGAVVASLVGGFFSWRTAYFIGGGLGVSLLLLRVGVVESGLFEGVKERTKSRGNFWQLFSTWDRARRYLAVIFVGVPIWYTVGILILFSSEIGKAMGMTEAPSPGRAVFFCYAGLAAGDLASGALSQVLKSRRRALLVFLLLTGLTIAVYFTLGKGSLTAFYAACVALGVANGYWAVFVTVAAEQFGTNLRGTATTTVPNFVRGMVVPLTALFQLFKGSLGVVGSAVALGAGTLIVAFFALFALGETYGKDLDFLED